MGIRFLCILLCFGVPVLLEQPLAAAQVQAITTPVGSQTDNSITESVREKSQSASLETLEVPIDQAASEASQSATLDDAQDQSEPAEPAPPAGGSKAADSKAAVSKTLHSSQLLPIATKAWFSVPNVDQLEEQFEKTQFGHLAADPEIKPFVESIKTQAQDWLDDKNVRLGVKIEDIDQIHSGEICVAGVLQDLAGGQPARGSHGLILLVDITGNEAKANTLFEKVNAGLEKSKGAVQEKIEINGVDVTKITIKNPKRIRHNQFSLQAVHNGWLLIADNEEIFRDIIRRIAAPEKIRPETTLSTQKPFTEIMKQTELFGNEPQFSWFMDPFGYLELAQKIAEQEEDVRKHHDDWPRILREQGFDAIRGMGGNIALSLSAKELDYELLNRAYIYAPRENLNENQKRVFDLFDFQPDGNAPPIAAKWVPIDASGYFSANWDFTKLLNSIGHVWDAFMGSAGEFDRMLDAFKTEPDFQLNVRQLVGMLDDQFSIVSTTERPITEDSERVVIGMRLEADADKAFVFSSIKRAVGRKNGKLIKLAGVDVIEVDTTIESDVDDLEAEFDLPPGFEEFDADAGAVPAARKNKFNIFKRRYFALHDGYLLVANDKLYLKKLLTNQQKILLSETEDYQQMFNAINRLTDASKVCFRQFARVDRALETNYEMLRRGEMAQSQTVLAKILNQIFESEEEQNQADHEPRKQKLDGSKLPEDFEKSVAPYLGPSGWVLETEPDGWRVTGCALKKIVPEAEVVEK